MDASEFWAAMKERGLNFFAGVPDSTFQDTYNVMVSDPDIRYVPAVREDVALGLALLVSIGECKSALAVHLAILPFANVLVSIGPCRGTIAMCNTSGHIPNVFASVVVVNGFPIRAGDKESTENCNGK